MAQSLSCKKILFSLAIVALVAFTLARDPDEIVETCDEKTIIDMFDESCKLPPQKRSIDNNMLNSPMHKFHHPENARNKRETGEEVAEAIIDKCCTGGGCSLRDFARFSCY